MAVSRTKSPSAEVRPAPIGGRWRNRLGSVMDLDVGDDGRLTGTFDTAVGGDPMTHDHPVTGFVCGDAVVFCVEFVPPGSLGTWAGHHVVEDGSERLVMMWHLARPVPRPHGDVDLWQGLLTGSDEFVRST